MGDQIAIRSADLEGAEVSWFAPICNGDFEYLGVMDSRFKSHFANASEIVRIADYHGYRNILCPSSYQVGQDTLAFAAAVGPMTRKINLLVAIRCGEVHPPMLGRSLATLDHILEGRLTINIISSDLPGETLPSEARYQRSREVIEILKQGWTSPEIDYKGEFYQFKLPTEPVQPYQPGGPLLYFGGYSPAALELCAQHCDVYLMWPETRERLHELMTIMSGKAAEYDRKLDFGLRVHVIVRETEAEARQAAAQLVSRLDDDVGTQIRNRAQDAHSLGVSRQTEMRALANADGFIEDHLWTGIGRGRSGCGAALVGDPDQILAKLRNYMDMGIRSFILSGYPHRQECDLFAKYVLPRLKTFSMPMMQGKIPSEAPKTPLAAGVRQ